MRTIFIFSLLLLLASCEPPNHKYRVVITYTTGQQDTLQMVQNLYPRVERNGCLYDQYEHTYICGVRKVHVKELGPDD